MSVSQTRRVTRAASLLVLPALMLAESPLVHTSQPGVSTTSVIGPIASTSKPGHPARDYVFYATPMDLTKVAYVEEEYFISGTATRYAFSGAQVSTTPIGTMPYRTRLVVRRPASAKAFRGVVVVDWQNVTGGHDLDSEWSLAGQFFVRSGWAWVGASVQRIGVHGFDPPNPLAGSGLKQWSSGRYGTLDLTHGGTVMDDSQSFDIYSQVAQAIRQPGVIDGLKGMAVRRIYAGGASQSANFLIRYYNGIQPQSKSYDGFLIGAGGGAPRLDQSTKLIKVLTETDVWRGQAANRVSDTESVHTWEIAGASHVYANMVSPDSADFRAILGGLRGRDVPLPPPAQCARPYPSNVEVWAVYSAAYAALDNWVDRSVRPSSIQRINVSAAPPSPEFATIVRDVDGLATGGIRLPRVAVPRALNTGENQPASCVLFGTHIPFDAAELKKRYPSEAAFDKQVRKVVEDLVQRGFVLKEDAPTLIRSARN
jgi:hypothetical protein